MTDTTQPDALARLLAAGHQVTYAKEIVGGWFADLRDAYGRCAETGLGATQEQALAHLCERLDRNAASAGDAVTVLAGSIESGEPVIVDEDEHPGAAAVGAILTGLLDCGYQVEFAKETEDYLASVVEGEAVVLSTGIADTPLGALEAAAAGLDGFVMPEKPADTAIVAAYADGYQAGIAVATPLEDAGLKAYDRQAHLAMYERTYPDSYCWPPVPRMDAEAEAAIDFYTGDGR